MSAIFSRDNIYRYRLERQIGSGGGPVMGLIMVNPSSADATRNDPTMRKVLLFAEHLEFGRVIVGNLFAFRSSKPSDLRAAKDPIGPDNDQHIERIMRESDRVFVAWGSNGKVPMALRKRWIDVVKIADRIGETLWCLDVCQDKHPQHPLWATACNAPHEWEAPWFPNRVRP